MPCRDFVHTIVCKYISIKQFANYNKQINQITLHKVRLEQILTPIAPQSQLPSSKRSIT
jgi:hypothetical protein